MFASSLSTVNLTNENRNYDLQTHPFQPASKLSAIHCCERFIHSSITQRHARRSPAQAEGFGGVPFFCCLRGLNALKVLKGFKEYAGNVIRALQSGFPPPENAVAPLQSHFRPPESTVVPLQRDFCPPENAVVPLQSDFPPPEPLLVPLQRDFRGVEAPFFANFLYLITS